MELLSYDYKPVSVSHRLYLPKHMEISENGEERQFSHTKDLEHFGIEEDQTHGVISLPSTVEGIHAGGNENEPRLAVPSCHGSDKLLNTQI